MVLYYGFEDGLARKVYKLLCIFSRQRIFQESSMTSEARKPSRCFFINMYDNQHEPSRAVAINMTTQWALNTEHFPLNC